MPVRADLLRAKHLFWNEISSDTAVKRKRAAEPKSTLFAPLLRSPAAQIIPAGEYQPLVARSSYFDGFDKSGDGGVWLLLPPVLDSVPPGELAPPVAEPGVIPK